MTNDEVLISWLMCSEAMERELVKVLTTQVKEAKGYPKVVAQIKKHLAETKVHQQKLEACLKEFDEKPNLGKDIMADFLAVTKGVISAIPYDKVIRNGITDFGVEHYEMAAYSAIIEVAKKGNHTEVVKMCEGIKAEEEAMANWLEANLPQTITAFLDKLTK